MNTTPYLSVALALSLALLTESVFAKELTTKLSRAEWILTAEVTSQVDMNCYKVITSDRENRDYSQVKTILKNCRSSEEMNLIRSKRCVVVSSQVDTECFEQAAYLASNTILARDPSTTMETIYVTPLTDTQRTALAKACKVVKARCHLE